MHHAISATGNDELTTLSQNVENMRESMLVNISKEREARAANTELITSMSHDIRTPLTVLLGYIDVMKLEEDPGSMKSYIKAAEQTALRLKDLSDDMFKYFLVSGEGAPAVSIASYDAKTLLEQMLYEHVLLLSEQGYDIAFEMPDIASGSMSIRTDAPYTMRIIDNLFSNIRKYADRSKPITLSAVREGDKLKVSFENSVAKDANEAESSGIGMKPSRRIAELLGLGFAYREEGNIFRTEVEFPIEISSNQ
jgi:signal transduction histidine kinase